MLHQEEGGGARRAGGEGAVGCGWAEALAVKHISRLPEPHRSQLQLL